ncbi:hypothetical protein CB0940_11858 [Cercospora beticola]|uniref:Trichothecene 3-O-acetyltransferase n=1 Tax=Cercospora beticola TaxID=122368 RepID=A0A2G5IDQ5_CERBT|nr:hypothetical protein CB0940_11858 [Cercospora beticola]PIB02987.1 hypothetical protein CB0940_11858 [Cercospora beticola]
MMAEFKVFPSEPVEKHTIKLSICDAYSPKVWVTQTHFWPLPDSSRAQRGYDILKEGLARTLAEIPALSGTIGRTSDDPRDLVVVVDDDAHVEFAWENLVGKAEIPSYAQLKEDGFPLTGLVALCSQPVALTPVHEGARMLTAKLNYLDGGMALSFGFNHLLADAATVAEVERIWSLHCADVSNGTQQKHKLQLPESTIRERLSKASSEAGPFDDEHWRVFPTTRSQLNLPRESVSKEAALTVLEETKKAHLASIKSELEETKWCMWKFSAEALGKLKNDASLPSGEQWISTMDALIGLFWSRLSFARQKSTEGHQESLMLFPINIRQRLEPRIETGYIGNAVDIVVSKCSLSELESDRGLVTAAQHVRKAVSGWKESKWAAWLNMAANLPEDEAICPNPLSLLDTHNMGFNDYSKSQSNVLSWGSELGVVDRTRYMRSQSLANCATAVIVHPRLADGGLEVAMTSTEHIKAALEKDKIFAQYASFVTTFT